jgi:hypothetical protein
MSSLAVVTLNALLLTAASGSPQEIKIEKIRPNVTWYSCESYQKRNDAPTWNVQWAQDLQNGFLKLLDENRKPSTYCVKDFAVITERKIPVEKECGTVVAKGTAATRGLGKECK